MKLITKFNSKSLIIIGLLSLILLIILILIYQDYQRQLAINNLPNNLQFPVAKEKIVSFAEYSNDQNPQEPIVQYIYGTTKEVPVDTYRGLAEDITKRTPSSQSFIKEIKKIDTDQEKITYVSKFYSGTTFYQADNNQWYYTESATTTKTAFLQQTKSTLVEQVQEIFITPAFAAVETIYAGAGDGEVYYGINDDCSAATWTSAHDALTGTGANYVGTTFSVFSGCTLLGGDQYVERGFLPFDTASLPDDASVSAASLNLDPAYNSLGNDDGYNFITVVQTTQASNTTLITADYDQCGAISNPIEGINVGDRVFSTSITVDNYFSLTLNTTGRSWISKTGYTKLGVREGHDILNIQPVVLGANFDVYTSEQTGTTKDPYLSITYSIVFSRVTIDGGRIKIDGGRLKIN